MANALKQELAGKTVILSRKYYKGTEEDRAFVCEDGFGVSPNTGGTAIFGHFVKDGEKCRVEGYEIEKLAKSTAQDKPS